MNDMVGTSEYAEHGSDRWEDELREAVRIATLAPSSHNSQPWRFRVRDGAVELLADRTRALPVADPDGCELTISCGAALFYLRLAVAHAGAQALVTPLPDPGTPDLLARVERGNDTALSPDEFELFNAIPRRRTDRRLFTHDLIPDGLPLRLQQDAAAEGAWLHVVAADVHDTLLDLIAEGDRRLWADAAYRRELASWLHPAELGDGLSALYRHGLGPHVVRRFDLGEREAKHDAALAAGAPMLVVLGTAGDTPAEWLRAGQALARVLLRAAAAGVNASFLNQPVQVPELRAKLARSVGRKKDFPQIVLRMGHNPLVAPTPRRPLPAVFAN